MIHNNVQVPFLLKLKSFHKQYKGLLNEKGVSLLEIARRFQKVLEQEVIKVSFFRQFEFYGFKEIGKAKDKYRGDLKSRF
jgi:hypothetical protein